MISDDFGEAAEIILSTKGKSLPSRVRSPDFIVAAVYDRRGFLCAWNSAVIERRYSCRPKSSA